MSQDAKNENSVSQRENGVLSRIQKSSDGSKKRSRQTTMHNKDNTREAEEIFDRILSEMERQGKRYAELTEFLNLPRGTFSSWKAGRSRNFCEHIGAIAEFLGVSAEYLITGNVDGKFAESVEEQQLLDCYRKLSPEKQETVLKNLRWLAE